MKKVFFSHGEKGGVGKSMCSLMLIETLYKKHGPEAVMLIECDASNPDAGRKAYHLDGLRLETADLREAEGWMELANLIESAPESCTIVINLPAQMKDKWTSELPLVAETFAALDIDVTVLWTINRQLDSVTLLDDAARHTPDGWKWVVVKNLHWGAPPKFVIFDAVNAKRKNKLPVVCLPEMNDLFMVHFSTRPGTFSTLQDVMDESGKPEYTTYERSIGAVTLRTAAEAFAPIL